MQSLSFRSTGLICLLAGAALFAGCGRRQTEVAMADRQKILLVGNGGEIQTLDPHIAGGLIDKNPQSALSEGLVSLDETSLQVRPGMAERWEVSGDGLIYTFHLRPGLKWSNGDPIKAEDWLFSFQRALSPNLASEYRDLYFAVQGAERFSSGATKDFSTVGFKMPDERTLVVTLKQRTPYFLTLLRNNVWCPVQKKAVLANGPADQRANHWTAVSNGPFRPVRWQIHQMVEVEKNPFYWDAAHVRLAGIRFYSNESLQGQDLAFRTGQLHATWSVPLSKLAAYRAEHNPDLREEPSLESYFVRFNVTRPPFNHPKVRRAFSLAIDRTAIVRSILRGQQVPAYTLTPEGFEGYHGPAGVLKFDPAAARALLAEAGFPGGQGFPAVDYLTISAETDLRIGEALCEMWRTNLGVAVGTRQEEFKVYLQSINGSSLNYALARGRWTPEYPDPLSFLEIMTSASGINGTGYADPAYDAKLAEANEQADSARRAEALAAAEALMLTASPIAPIYFGTTARLIAPEVKGWKPSPLGFHNYKDMWLQP